MVIPTGLGCEVNPARAGMIPDVALLNNELISKPRASGDDPDIRANNNVESQ